MQSPEIDQLAAALVKAQGEFSVIPKDSLNPFFKSKYAALPDVVAAASPILAKEGLAVSQFMSDDDTLTTYLLHSSGQFIAHTARLHLIKDDPQAQGSATTYLRRYSYMSCLGLIADEDDDANIASRPPAYDYSRPAAPKVEIRDNDPRLVAILNAENTGNSFVDDLCAKFRQFNHLTENQLNKGAEAATRPSKAPKPPTPPDPPTYDEEPF